MTREQAFDKLCRFDWENQTKAFKEKYRTAKCLFLNKSGKLTKNVSPEKMKEILEASHDYYQLVEEQWTDLKTLSKKK